MAGLPRHDSLSNAGARERKVAIRHPMKRKHAESAHLLISSLSFQGCGGFTHLPSRSRTKPSGLPLASGVLGWHPGSMNTNNVTTVWGKLPALPNVLCCAVPRRVYVGGRISRPLFTSRCDALAFLKLSNIAYFWRARILSRRVINQHQLLTEA